MIKALFIAVVWIAPNTYTIEHTHITFDTYRECLNAKRISHYAPNHRLAVVAQDIICDGA
jgi:hypothetical protein